MQRRATGVVIGFAAFAATLAGANACLRTTQFNCESDGQCGNGGTCQLASGGFCSFADSSCAGSMQRFDSSAGSLANQCVGGDQPGSDGGPPDDMNMGGEPPADMCPSDYVTLTGEDPKHKYKPITQAKKWDQSHNDCVSQAPGRAYLAIPDSANELAGLAALSPAKYWVGINDVFMGSPDDETFVDVKGVNHPPGFTAFAANEPNAGGGGPNAENCIAVNNSLMSSEKCGASLAYICECEEP